MFRRLTTALLPAVLVATMAVAPALAAARVVDTGAEAASFDLVNQARAANGRPALVRNSHLTQVARDHSEAMAADVEAGGECGDGATLRHRSPLSDGITITWTKLRENVGCGWGAHGTAEVVHDGFMNSPGHRGNILADDINQVGVGAFRDVDGGLWITQIFMQGPITEESGPVAEPTPETVHAGVSVSQDTFGDGKAAFAVIARADDFADSLGGAALAGGDGPILFTPSPNASNPDPKLDPYTRAELDRVLGGSGTVYLLGGHVALGPAVEDELRAAGYDVQRLAGATRYDTAVLIAQQVVQREGSPDTILIAYGRNWPDAVTGGAAAARNGLPVVLTERDSVPSSTASFLAQHPGADRIVLGGTVVVSEEVRSQLGASRVWGMDRAATAVAVAEQVFGPTSGRTVVIEGWNADGWARSMALAAVSARTGAPQVIVSVDAVPDATATFVDHTHPDLIFADDIPSAVRNQLTSLAA